MFCSNERCDVFLSLLSRQYKRILLLLFVVALLLMLEGHYDAGKSPMHSDTSTDRQHTGAATDYLTSKLRVDRLNVSEEDILRDAQKSYPYMPILFWEQNKARDLYYKNKSCARFPDVYNLQLNNLYWQMLRTNGGMFYLYGAYYDKRERNSKGPTIRVLVMVDRTPTLTTYCQMWFTNRTEPVIVKNVDYHLVYNQRGWKIGPLYPYQILYPVPKEFVNRVPEYVSVVEKMCDTAPNCLRVIYRPRAANDAGRKNRIAVCVKRFDFLHQDMSVRLIEWIELLGILGVERIFMYPLEVHENVTKVLEYYKKCENGRPAVEVTPISLPGGQPNIPGFRHVYNGRWPRQKVRNEIVSNNDCLYKSIYQYDYVLVVDSDEVVIPVHENNYPDLMEKVKQKAAQQKNTTYSHYMAGMWFFRPDADNSTGQAADIPPYMYMLQHVTRDKNYDRFVYNLPKTFFDTQLVASIKVHYPNGCLGGECVGYRIDLDDARMHHYRSDDYPFLGERKEGKDFMFTDTTIRKFKLPLINRTVAVLNELNFFEEQ